MKARFASILAAAAALLPAAYAQNAAPSAQSPTSSTEATAGTAAAAPPQLNTNVPVPKPPANLVKEPNASAFATNSGPEAVLGQRRVPRERIVFGDDNIGAAVTVEIDEPQVRVIPVHVRHRLQRRKRCPVVGRRALEEPAQRALECHAVQLPVAGQIEKLVTRHGSLCGGRQ